MDVDITLSPRFGILLLAVLLVADPVQAQIVTDGTVGPKVSLRGGEIEIGANLGSRRGDNLFHSFERFGIATGQTATFTGPGDVKNVISRVTGGEVSNIDGTLASKVGQADLYFLNPAGVMFGPNSKLDVPGSFHVSTAQELRFADGARFSALDKTGSGLTVAPPETFGFLDRAPGRITVDQSRLQLSPGKTFSLVGGDMDIFDGVIAVAGGSVRIHAGTLTVANSVIDADNIDDWRGVGGIDLTAGNLAFTDSRISASAGGTGPGGTIAIKADTMTVLNSGAAGVPDRHGIHSDTRSAGDAGAVNIQAGSLTVSGSGAGITSDALAGSTGKAGSVAINSGTLTLSQGGGIRSDTWAGSSGGTVNIQAGSLFVTGDGVTMPTSTGPFQTAISSDALAGSSGTGGHVTVNATNLDIQNGGGIHTNTWGSGDAGTLLVQADTLNLIAGGPTTTEISSNAYLGSTAGSGNVTVIARDMTVRNGGGIRSDIRSNAKPGPVGMVDVRADRLLILGDNRPGTGISSDVINGQATRNAGNINVEARELQVRSRGNIQSVTRGGGNAGTVSVRADTIILSRDGGFTTGIQSDADLTFDTPRLKPTGAAGNVFVDARDLQIYDARIHSDTLGDGPAGSVVVRADRLFISGINSPGFTGITSEARNRATAPAGNVTVTARTMELVDSGQISSDTYGLGHAGKVTVQVEGTLSLIGKNSRISSVTRPNSDTNVPSPADAGNVEVTTGKLVLRKGAVIRSDSLSDGNAGTVMVQTGDLFISGDDSPTFTGISSASDPISNGNGGNVIISARSITVADGGAISAESQGSRPGGSIEISAAHTLSLAQGAILAQTATNQGGDIRVSAGRLFNMNGSTVTTSVAGGTGSGGNIFVTSPLVVLESSKIQGNALRGSGGNITIQGGQLIQSSNSVIQASSELGLSGTVTIAAPNTDVASSLIVLPETFIDVSSQLREACTVRSGRPANSFAAGGRGGLPPDPSAPLSASPFGQPLEKQSATGSPSPSSRRPQAAKPVTVAGVPQPVPGSPRLTCRG
jgi:filamentous hemagglutinin family protein